MCFGEPELVASGVDQLERVRNRNLGILSGEPVATETGAHKVLDGRRPLLVIFSRTDVDRKGRGDVEVKRIKLDIFNALAVEGGRLIGLVDRERIDPQSKVGYRIETV